MMDFVFTDFSGGDAYGNAVILHPDGRITVAGSSNDGKNSDFAIARYHADGSLDIGFDEDGRVTTNYYGSYEQGNAAVLQPNGKLVVAGYIDYGSGTSYDFALARYNSNGSLDASFGVGGR